MPRVMGENEPRKRRRPPALTPEEEENRLISLATSLASKRLEEGTASNQIITYFLRRGSIREQLEQEKLKRENALLVAKVEALESAKRDEELIAKVLKAMKEYSGADGEYDDARFDMDEY